MKCQSCGGEHLEKTLSLGYLPPPNDMWPVGTVLDRQTWMPTDLMLCHSCNLVQLGYTGPQDVVFPAHYPYTSGVTKNLRLNFAELAVEMRTLFNLKENDLIVDIGSNDGTLLSNFVRNHVVVGVEPTNIADLANERGIKTIKEFFSPSTARAIIEEAGALTSRRFVTCANCFAHMDNIPSIMEGVIDLIGDDGVFVTESHYLMDLLQTLQYDTIYHEHLRYYSLVSIRNLLWRYGLQVIHARRISTHGGSIRVYAKRANFPLPVSKEADDLLRFEPVALGLIEKLNRFARDVAMSKLQLMATMRDLRRSGFRVAGISAPSRAATVINYCRLELDYVAELTGSLKLGKYMPGTSIPVVDEEILFGAKQPEAAVLFSWHIADEIIPKLRAKGFLGRIILPCARAGQAYANVA